MAHVLVYSQTFSSCDPKSVQNLYETAFKNKKLCYSLTNAEIQYPELISLRMPQQFQKRKGLLVHHL